jgi:predicted nucleic acid-binding protein
LCAGPGHEFWGDSVSLLDESLFRPQAITGHRQITDIYLLGLAVRHGGRLATFDRSIPVKAVVGAGSAHLELIGSLPTAP